jgi:hypothetical protein
MDRRQFSKSVGAGLAVSALSRVLNAEPQQAKAMDDAMASEQMLTPGIAACKEAAMAARKRLALT